MQRLNQIVLMFILGVGFISLISCQAQQVRPLTSVAPPDNPNPQTEPLVRIAFDGFDPETTTLRFSEGQTVVFEIDSVDSTVTTASLSQTSGPAVNFGEMSASGVKSNGDVMAGDGMDDIHFTLYDVEGSRVAVFKRFVRLKVEFVVPSVTRRTNMTFRFQSSSPTQSRTRSIPIIIEDDAGAITLSGKVSKGLVSNAEVKLFSVDGYITDFLSPRQIVEPGYVDATGTYTFTLLPAIDFAELLLYKIEGDGADMVCDAPQGCGQTGFGQTFEVKDLDLRAYLPVPSLGTTQTVNINILTSLVERSAKNLADERFEGANPEYVQRGREEVSGVFGLPDQDFTKVPFVDVTRPITSTDENAIRAAMIAGGVLGAAFSHSDPDDSDDYLEELDEFIEAFGDGKAACRDTPAQTTASIEDVMVYARDLANINGSTATRAFFSARLAGIRNGSIRCPFLPRSN